MQPFGVRSRSASAPRVPSWKRLLCGVSCLGFGLGCSGNESGPSSSDESLGSGLQELKGAAARVLSTETFPNSASNDNGAFGWKLYAAQAEPAANVVFSPYSISTAVAMLVGGTAGATKTEIEQALEFSTEGDAFDQSRDALALALAARNRVGAEQESKQTLTVSNGIWLAPDFRPPQAYLNELSAYYGAGVYLAPFDTAPEQARQAINQKVSNDTAALIPELLPAGSLDEWTRLVLTNTLYLEAKWQSMFSAQDTADAPFQAQSGATLDVPMMHQVIDTGYAARPGYEVLALPYANGELEFVAVMPTAGSFDDFVRQFDAETASAALAALDRSHIALAFPKFKFDYQLPLEERLEGLGMTTAFTDFADLSGIGTNLKLSGAFHTASIDLDEFGTRAAAATALTVVLQSVPQPVSFDHPFIFFIQDVQTHALLFVGQYANP
jgi:serpin B